MSLYRSDKKYKTKLSFLIALIFFSIFIFFPKQNWKQNIAQNIRIYTCQPNFTTIYDNQNFKIERLFYGLVNFIKKGCKYENLKININFENYNIIKEDRQIALINGVLTNPREVSATIVHNNEKFRSDVRLKGDLSNHWDVNKQWSLKIELKDGKSINGMKEFSITKLIERKFPDNLVISNQFIRHGIISPKFKIYKTNVNGQNWGLMIAEEQFSNVFLENRKLKDGLIFKLTNEASSKISINLKKQNIKPRNVFISKQDKVNIDIFNKKKINKYKYLQDQETLIKSIREKLNTSISDEEKYTLIKKYFDIDKLAKLLANVTVFNTFHSLNRLNLRFYLNPYNLVIEPIPTDNYYKLASTDKNNFKKELGDLNVIFLILYKDENFRNTFKAALLEIQSNLKKIKQDSVHLCEKFEDYCSDIINFKNMENHIVNLISIGPNIFPQNNLEKKKFNTDASKLSTTKKELTALKTYNDFIYARFFNNYLKVYNNTLDKIRLKDLIIYTNEDSTKCEIFKIKNCNSTKYNLDIYLDNTLEVSHKKIDLNLLDSKNIVWAKIRASIKNENFNYFVRLENHHFDLENFTDSKIYSKKYLKDLKDKTFFISGKLFIDEPIIVPKNYNLIIAPGSELIFTENSYIYLNKGSLNIDGTKKMINLRPSGNFWGGIYVNNSPKLSKINNAQIIATKNFEHEGIHLTGGLNFYKSNVDISNLIVLDNKCEDAINIINSKFKLKNSQISNTLSDGIDSDFSNGLISNTIFENIGGDAIDTSGSKVSIFDTEIYNSEDKALSAGEKSEIYIENLKIDSSKFGLVSKDLSTVKGEKISVTNSIDFDILAFEKKMHYGPGFINIRNVQSDDKIQSQTNSVVFVNDKEINNEDFDSKKFY